MSRNDADSSRIVFGAIGAVVLLGGIWYTATLRAENAMLRAQVTRLESGALANETRAVPAGAPKSSAATTVAPRADSRPQRTLSDDQRTAMRYELSDQPGRKVWFAMQARDPETASFQRELEAVFLESGWEIAGISEAGYRIKAGVYLFMADDEPPAHVSTALRGLEAAGLEVVAGTGYRAYYAERKAADPNFRGHELGPEQEFVIVVGPNDDSST